MVKVDTSGGRIESIDGSGSLDAHTSGGSIVVRNFGGDTTVETSGGRLSLENINGKIVGRTSGGSITARLRSPVPGDVNLETSAGSIEVMVPPDAGLDVEAEASAGRVTSELPFVGTRTDREQMKGKINGGGKSLSSGPAPAAFRSNQRLTKSRHANIRSRFMNDLRYAFRQLRKSPGFTLIAVLTLALGIGANTAIFSVIYAVLLRPLPYPDGDRLMIMTETDANQPQISVSFPDYVDWKRDNTAFEQIAISRRESFNLSGLQGRAPEQISGALVTANFFKVIGLTPQLGRVFTEEEDRVGGPLRRRNQRPILAASIFRATRTCWARSVNFGNQPYTIIGVMPPQMFSPRTVEVWFPVMRRTDNPAWQTRDNHPGLFGWGRLKQGVTREQALNELKQIAARLAKQYPDSNSAVSVTVTPLLENQVGDYRASLNVVARRSRPGAAHCLRKSGEPSRRTRRGAGAGVCGSRRGGRVALANHSPALDREPRSCARWRVARALSGRLGSRYSGCAFAAGVPRFQESVFDGWVLSFSLALSVVTSVLFGLWPAWHTSRADIQLALKSGGHGSSEAPGARRSRDLLVIAEVALTLVLLSTAGLVLKSFANARALGLGFDPRLLLSARIDLPEPTYSDPKKTLNFSDGIDGEVICASGRGERRARIESAADDGMADIICP